MMKTHARTHAGQKSTIRKRHMHLTEQLLSEHPNLCASASASASASPSLDVRQSIALPQIPLLAHEASLRALSEWGLPRSRITHLIFCTSSCLSMPGPDYLLSRLLSLPSSVSRLMLFHQGCFAGASALRLAKDLAENNSRARILAVCSEITALTFRGPSESHPDSLVGQALFGDGASAVIIGSDPKLPVEKPLFQLVSASQTILPDSEGAIDGHLREIGLTFHLLKDVPGLIERNMERILAEALAPLGVRDWNEVFWVAHPGGPAILDGVEKGLGLEKGRLEASRRVLAEYGNMSSACVMFVLDEMRRRSKEGGRRTTGEGLEFGVLFGFGPGLTVETVVLRSVPIEY